MTTITKTKTEYTSLLSYLKKSKLSFTTRQGKHSMSVISDKFKLNFVSSLRSNKFFNATKKIEKDLSSHEIPLVDEDNLEYFTHDIRKDIFEKNVYTVDISSAYATSLLIKGFISDATYKYILNLSKPERLACVGMLAKESLITTYNKGEAITTDLITNEKRPFFFITVEEVSSIMRCIKMEAHKDYIMTWVDCVYLRSKSKVPTIIKMLESFGYSSKGAEINNLRCSILDTKISVTYEKHGNPTGFYIPHLKPLNVDNNETLIQSLAKASRVR